FAPLLTVAIHCTDAIYKKLSQHFVLFYFEGYIVRAYLGQLPIALRTN
ncbi:hypothetical protein EZS27_032458, partial [termite gut metagenome]